MKAFKLKIFSVGGTIDKIYFDQKSRYEVGEPKIREILIEANVNFDYEIEPLMQKDSLDLTDRDRQFIFDKIESDPHRLILVTHGTDTMVETAKKLKPLSHKVIVLTGAIEPASFKTSDAAFNIGCAVAAVQTKAPGVYIAMNGRVFLPHKVKKNLKLNRFEDA